MPQTVTPRLPAAEPTPVFVANAREVVANPEQYADRPILRRLAWMTLMANAGRRLSAEQLAAAPVETPDA